MSYGPRSSSRTTLYVTGFPPDMEAWDLAYDFEKIGPLVRCDIPPQKTPHSKLYAFVEYDDPRDAEDAYHDLHGMPIGRYRLHVDFAKLSSKPRHQGPPPPRSASPQRRRRDYDDRERAPPPRRADETRPGYDDARDSGPPPRSPGSARDYREPRDWSPPRKRDDDEA
ncbi:unnamed protein product [Malassezia sympodialis ATCC 42132]|uniref:Uncharacterized protein n=1 Tax=Malassezia sympodialis (strain ATCC 42132) TaxID=1230383 RepID=M5EC79_MALS4|nr:uncharacterized protein MSY001_2643 [Malassezia sympodialis ATCC 42132]CCU99937.1 unnamed protein product [Malassezia sympodialis ATCC 42132]SHO76214.1 Uncharacterized protein MSYG_0551 [Malassezia sympodialis ATCC 42132]|eukprot:XP_018741158.1 uncharacterized protein MSY001_2643 [Malassezia sympodialis ATCC 42132]